MTTPDKQRAPGRHTSQPARRGRGHAPQPRTAGGVASSRLRQRVRLRRGAQAASDVNAPGIPALPASMVPMCGVYNFFTKAEARTVEAFAIA